MVLSVGGTREKIPGDNTADRSRDRLTSSAVHYPLRYTRPPPVEVRIAESKFYIENPIMYVSYQTAPRNTWEDNIKMDLQEVGCGDMDWIELAEEMDRWRALVNAVMNLRVP